MITLIISLGIQVRIMPIFISPLLENGRITNISSKSFELTTFNDF